MKAEELSWWHSIELPDGSKTRGIHDYDTAVGDRYLFPDVKGKEVLDIGTFDGYWSVRAVKGGASRVVAVDWVGMATAVLVSGMYGFQYDVGDDYNHPVRVSSQYDVVLFYGVVYHLYNPIQGIINAGNQVRGGGTLLLESAVNQRLLAEGALCARVHDNDDTNYFLPTTQELIDAILLAQKISGRGYKIEEIVHGCGDKRVTFKITMGAQ